MDLTDYIIGFIWGIVVSYIVNKIYKYYKTKQIVEMMMDSIPEEELMQLFKEIDSGILYWTRDSSNKLS